MSPSELPEVTIYTDGGCSPNPGPGGWGAVILEDGASPRELSGGEATTTNNRMELTAAAMALSSLAEPCRIALYTDSQYLKRGITEWIANWQRRGWQTAGKTPVKNVDLWQALSAAMEKHQITWRWVKGHAGHKWNERADQLATQAMGGSPEPAPVQIDAIQLFTEVSYRQKTRTGAWAVVLRFREHTRVFGATVENVSANRLHLIAALEGLKAVKKPMAIHLFTRSDYLKNGAALWMANWKKKDWKTREGTPVKNADIWRQLLSQTQTHKITWHSVDSDDAGDDMQLAKSASAQELGLPAKPSPPCADS